MTSDKIMSGETAAIKDAKIDRISNLPGDVLPAILSKLPLRDAVRTSVLSTYWSHKWCALSQLVVDSRHIESVNSQLSSFPTWEKIKTILYNYLRYHSDAIEKFKLSIDCPWHIYRDLYQLIYFLSKKEIKEFSLEQYNPVPIGDIPDPLFSFQHLSNLQLTRCRIKLPFNFKGLKFLVSLHLKEVYIKDETFARLLSDCPAIERLVFLRIEVIHHFRIIGQSLKYLKLESKFDRISFENCPNLKSSEIGLITEKFGRYNSSSEDDSLDSGSESDNYDSGSDNSNGSDHFDSESNGSYSGSEISDSGSNLSDCNTDNSSFVSDNPESEGDSYNSGTDYSDDESYYSDNDSSDSEQHAQVIGCNLLSALGDLSSLERISLCTRFFKFLAIDDINKMFPIAHKQLIAIDLREIDFRRVNVVRMSLLLLNKFPNLEEFDFSVKYSGIPESAIKLDYEECLACLPFEKLRAVKMRYRGIMGIAFSHLKVVVDHSPMLETVTVINDGENLVPQYLLEEQLQLLKRPSPQVKVQYQAPKSGIVCVVKLKLHHFVFTYFWARLLLLILCLCDLLEAYTEEHTVEKNDMSYHNRKKDLVLCRLRLRD